MEITFDTIINYLSTKKKVFISKVNIIKSIDEFNFDLPMFRIGIMNNYKNKNVSLIQSILYLINKEYLYLNDDEKIKSGNSLIIEMKNYWKSNYDTDENFKSNISLIEGEKCLINFEKNIITDYKQLLYVVSFCLKLNFIVLDFEQVKSSVISYFINDDNINTFRPFIIISKNENDYEPSFNHEKKLLNYDDVINYLTNYNSIQVETLFKTTNETTANSTSVFINDNIYTFEKLNKMKKAELMEICDSKGIKYIKKDLKKTLIEKILN